VAGLTKRSRVGDKEPLQESHDCLLVRELEEIEVGLVDPGLALHC